ncbi:MAG: EF-P beta-lysylation protein EpmB [Halioglobus sp.]|nr:EF-P beta-lysylation protein EpmB [Halioglobus sp.]
MNSQIPMQQLGADWRTQLRDAQISVAELLAALDLAPGSVDVSAAAQEAFALRVPAAFIRRMRRGDPEDPLLLQVLPQRREMQQAPGYHRDPVGETGAANPRPGVVHKYHGRALLIVTGSCAVNCRYCFRRHFPYHDNRVGRAGWREALAHVRDDSSISEVILSGGDPLVAGSRQLHELVDEIAAIEHVRRLRVHSRLPVVLPDRVTRSLTGALTRPDLTTVMVLHANHAREIDADVTRAVAALREAGMQLLNQAVLLAGINDTLQAQVALSESLLSAGVLPYYLHLLDRVQGAAHFEVPEQEARALYRSMRASMPGYLLPRMVRETAGAEAKIGLDI